MQVETHATNLPTDEKLQGQIERSLRFALGRLAQQVRRVVVRLRDVNGPRGGVDIACSVRAFLARGEPLIAQATASEPALAVALASRRIARRTTRAIERRRSHR